MRTVLAKETGLERDVALDRLLEEAGEWKGRAQQISLLKVRRRSHSRLKNRAQSVT
jgi:hypothetical protein